MGEHEEAGGVEPVEAPVAESHVMENGVYSCGDKGGTYEKTTRHAGAVRCVACGAPVARARP